MVEWLQFSLRVWDRRGVEIRRAEFLDRLSLEPGDPVDVENGLGVPRVQLFAVSMANMSHIDNTEDAGAQSEAFAAAIREGLIRAALWLERQPSDVFKNLREFGHVTDVFVGGWITDGQFELDLPPEFLLACGKLGLTVSICTND